MGTRAEDHIGEEFGIYKIIGVSPRKHKDGHKLYEAECKECGFIRTDRYYRLKNEIVIECTHVHEYRTVFCLYCGKEIPVGNLPPSEYNGRKFCNASCAASYNNTHREVTRQKKENTNANVDVTKEKSGSCLNCGKAIPKQGKYCSQVCQNAYLQSEWEKKWFAGEVSGNVGIRWIDTSKHVKTYLLKKYNNSCAKCGWSETNPYTGTIPLEVEHIDGDPYNTTPENVTLLCPNCHSLTSTYKGANKGRGRKKTWVPAPLDTVKHNA